MMDGTIPAGDAVAARNELVIEMRAALRERGMAGTRTAEAVEWFVAGLPTDRIAQRMGIDVVGVHSLLTRARKRGVPVPTAAALNQVRRRGRPKGTRTAEMSPEVARRLAEMGKRRRMTAGELGAALLAALSEEPVLVANLLDEGAP